MKIYLAGNGIGGKPVIKQYYKMFRCRLLSFHYATDWAKKQFEYLHELKNKSNGKRNN